MLSEDEKKLIRLGAQAIRRLTPDATLDEIKSGFGHVYFDLPEADRDEAYKIIEEEFYRTMN